MQRPPRTSAIIFFPFRADPAGYFARDGLILITNPMPGDDVRQTKDSSATSGELNFKDNAGIIPLRVSPENELAKPMYEYAQNNQTCKAYYHTNPETQEIVAGNIAKELEKLLKLEWK